MHKKLLIFLAFAFVFFIANVGSVSAMDWDNCKYFDQNTQIMGKITIKNLCILDKVAEYIVTSNENGLFSGEATGEVVLYKDAKIFDSIEFKDKKEKSKDVPVKIYIGQNKSIPYPVNDYKENCKNVGNGTVCTQDLVGSHNETRYEIVWKEYSYEKLSEGHYYWKIVGSKKKNVAVDWVVTGQGKKFDEWAWWDANWNYKKAVNFSITANPTNADFQARINLTWTSKMNNDFSDVRFTNSAENTELPYYIENKVDGAWADIWVRLPTNVTTTNQTLAYLYYNSTGASAVSNVQTTFNFYDDFSASNTTKWTAIQGSLSVAGGKVTVDGDWLYSNIKFGNYMMLYELKMGGGGSIADGQAYNYPRNSQVDGADDDGVFAGTNCGTATFSTSNEGTGASCGGASITYTTSSLIGVAQANTSWVGAYINDALILQDTTNIPDEQMNFTIRDWDGGTWDADWVRVRGFNDSIVKYSFGAEEQSNSPIVITLINPADNYYTTATNFTFIANVTDNSEVSEVKFFLDGVVNDTNTSLLNGTYTWPRTLAEGNHTWSVGAEDDEGSITNSSTRKIILDFTTPTIAIGNVSNRTAFALPINSTLQINGTDANIDDCYYNYTGQASYLVISCNSWINISWATAGSKTVQYCANDTIGNSNCSTANLIVYYLQTATSDSPDPTGEGTSVQYDFQVNETATGLGTTTANLIHNGTTYAVSSISSNGTMAKFQKNITMQDGWGSATGQNVSFYWNYNVSGITTGSSTSTENTTVYSVAFDNCGVYGDHILDWKLKDEELNSEVNGSSGSNVEIDLQAILTSNSSLSWTHNETWTNASSGSICVPTGLLSGDTNYEISFTMGFDSTDHVWEFFYLDGGNLNSTKNFNNHTSGNISLMDLLTTDSTSFLFNYFNQDGLAEAGSVVHVFRKYIGDGTFIEVERAKADEGGDTVIHLVEEDVIYYFMITLDGEILYTSATYTALCQATPCEISLEASGDFIEFESDWDLISNGGYSIASNDATRQVNLSYDLTSSSTMNLTIYSFDGNGTYTSLVSDAETGTNGVITVTIPQISGNKTFFASVYQDGQFIKSEWINFENDFGFYIGDGLAIFLAFLVVLTLGLVAVSEGAGTIVFVVLGLAVTGFLGLVRFKGSTGYGLLIYIICAGAILIYKLTRRNED